MVFVVIVFVYYINLRVFYALDKKIGFGFLYKALGYLTITIGLFIIEVFKYHKHN